MCEVFGVLDIWCDCSGVCVSADSSQASPEKRLEDMIRLGELCMEVLQQNDEHHSEVGPAEYLLILTGGVLSKS